MSEFDSRWCIEHVGVVRDHGCYRLSAERVQVVVVEARKGGMSWLR